MSARRFFDTNVLVYASDSSDAAKQARAVELLREAGLAGDGAISVQVLGEFFHVLAVKRKLLPAADAERLVEAYAAVLAVQPVELPLVEHAMRIHQQYQTRYWDSLIIAAAVAQGCTEIVSEDLNHGQLYEGVRVLNPFPGKV